MALDLPPPIPDPGDRATFSGRVGAFLQWEGNTLVPQFNRDIGNFNSALAGGALAIPFTIKADPGAGALVPQNTDQTNSPNWYIGESDSAGNSLTKILNSFSGSTSAIKGIIKVVKASDMTKWIIFATTGQTALNSGFRTFAATPIDGSATTPFVAGDAVILYFQRTGDKGDVGALSFPTFRAQDQRTTGTTPGASVAGANTRALNTTVTNTISGAGLSSNQITLPAGKYKVTGSAPGYTVNGHKTYLYSITGSTTLMWGTSEIASASYTVQTRSLLVGEITLSATTVLEFRHYTQTAVSNGLGGINGSPAGSTEVWAEIIFEKMG